MHEGAPRWAGRILAEGVTVCSADGRELRSGVAVCTLPLGVLKTGRVRFVPALPESKRSALEELVMGPVVKVLLRFEERFWPRWLANLGCSSGPLAALELTVLHPAVVDRPPQMDNKRNSGETQMPVG